MKKSLAIIMCITMMFLMTSCIDNVPLAKQAIVKGAGIDLDDDGNIKLTLQIFSTSGNSQNSIGVSQENAKILTGVGKSVTEALSDAEAKQGKTIFGGHNRIIVIGENLAKKNIKLALNFYSTQPISKKNISIAIANGNAEDILKTSLKQGIVSAQTLQEIIANANHLGLGEEMELFSLETAMINNHDSSFIPILEKIEEDKSDKNQDKGDSGKKAGDEKSADNKDSNQIEEISNIKFVGMGLIKENKLIDKIDKNITRGALWIRKEIDKTTVYSKTEKFDLCTANIYDCNYKLSPEIVGKNINFNLNISASAYLGELILKENICEDDIIEIQNKTEAVIKDECEKAF
ncbi:MAG: Ger(x)C family spore germination protein, partial [Oscillospiraceae bacterium]